MALSRSRIMLGVFLGLRYVFTEDEPEDGSGPALLHCSSFPFATFLKAHLYSFFFDLCLEKKKADIVFLLDGSINFRRENFQEVLTFVSEIVDTLYETGDSIQVGLVQYNSDPTDEFFLREFSTKQEILDAISKVVYKGGRHANTKVGVEHLRLHHFVPEAGSRLDQRVPQIAFVITGGKSVEDAQQASLALTQRGVKVFAVGVRNIDSQEVSRIASNSATAFRVGTVQELSELSEQVLETLYDAMHETLCPGVTDVSKGNTIHAPILIFSLWREVGALVFRWRLLEPEIQIPLF